MVVVELTKLVGKTIGKVTAELQADFETTDRYGIQTGQPFTLSGPTGESHIDPEGDPTNHDAVNHLVGLTIEQATADDQSGTLTIKFSGGWSMRIEPDGQYEAWDFSGPQGTEVICLPNGELAIVSVDDSSDAASQ